LLWLRNQLARLQRARQQFSFVYQIRGYSGETIWYLIRQGRVESAVLAPHSTASRQVAAATVEAIYFSANRVGGPAPLSEVDTILLISAWFRRHPRELARTLSPAEALKGVTHPVERDQSP
jgi:excinuclease ABC subunit C